MEGRVGRDTRVSGSLWTHVGGIGRLGAVGLVVAVVWVAAVALGVGPLMAGDAGVLGWVVGWRTPGVVRVMTVVTDLGSPLMMTLLALVVATLLAWRSRSGRAPALLAVGLVGAAVLDLGAKYAVRRPRPPVALHAVVAHGPSLPSGHVTVSAALVPLLAFLLVPQDAAPRTRRAAAAVATVVVLVIGVSRVVLGVHYVSDVVAGWLLGGTWACLVVAGERLLRAARRAPTLVS